MSSLKPAREYTITSGNRFSIGLRELWIYRELFFFFTWRDIKVKYKQTAFGILWAIVQPLALMVLFTVIFNKALNVGSEGMPYPVFAFSGLLIWNIFSNGMLNSANSMVNNAGIIKKIYFPRLIIPISAILTAVFDFLFALIIFAGLLLYYKLPVNFPLLAVYFPLSLLLTLITTFGLGTLLAALNVKYRDFQYALPFMIQFLLFVNPVLYSSKAFQQEWMAMVMRLNPIATAINLNRAAFNNSTVFFGDVVLSFLAAFTLFFAGLYVFRKTERYFADIA